MQIEVLGERYQLQDPIGRGGMATIYRGRDMRMDRTVAIKVLREVYSTDPKFVTRFQREAKAASVLQHPNIVQVFDYGQSDGNYFIVMELVEGTDLRRYMRSRGVLAVDRAIIIAHDVALGLGAAHRRSIVHRDVKPQNVLVGRDGSIKLTDFGIASVYKDINDERLTTTGMTLGTVQYYAPEQAQGEIVSPAADVYALGIVMYEMLTGRTPFDGDTPVAVAMQHIQDTPLPPSQFNPNIPPALEEIILRCMEKVPEMRYRDGSTLARALEMLGEEENATLPSASMTPTRIITPPVNGLAPANGVRPLTSSPQQAVGAGSFPPEANGAGNGAQMILGPEPGLYQAPHLSPDSTAATTAMEPAGYAQSNGNDATRPFGRDSLANASVVRGQRDSHMVGLVTALALVATIVLLGFSIFLAGELHFLPFFSFGNSASPTASVTQQVPVPKLIGMTFQQAQSAAQQKGFTVTVTSGPAKGIVKGQWPNPGDKGTLGIPIRLEMRSLDVVPNDLVGRALDVVKQELKDDGINYTVQPDPLDPTDVTRGTNIITRTDPTGGSKIEDNELLTLYVTNYTNGTQTTAPTTTVAPTTVAQPTATPTTAAQPTATPTTAAQPTPTPTTAAQPTPTPTPFPFPTVGPTATPASTTNTTNNT
jgi:eukaryotic-like serine/threonine-protein kinase